MLLSLALLALVTPQAPPPPACEAVTLTVLATTDTHGHVYPWDYYTAQPAARGLAAASTLIEEVRRENPNTVLIDGGDTIQGSPLESVHQNAVKAGLATGPDPMMAVMNAMGYDAMAVGNHEFNFGLGNLQAARESARFPWLSANTLSDGTIPPFAPAVTKMVAGVKVAIMGVTTGNVPAWEKPEQIRGLRFLSPEEGVERALAALEAERPDLIVAVVHSGLDRDARTGVPRPGEPPWENRVWQIAERFPQLTAIVYGHTHQREEGRRVGQTLLVQPRHWAMEVARIDIELVREPGGRFRVDGVASRLLPVDADTRPDPRILELARPWHEAAEAYLDRPVAEAPVELSGARARYEDSALVDAVHEVQLHYAKADVSLTALFRPQARLPKGQVRVRDLAGLYVYDNELYAVEGDGRMLRAALENAARYFRTCPQPACTTGPLVDGATAGYNFDMAQGVSYRLDLTQPVGSRVRDLVFRGAPLRDDEPLRIAINNYRASGSAGYAMFRGAKVVWKSGRDIRDLLVEYYTARERLPERPDGNWRIDPPAAVETLTREEAAPR